MGFVVVVGVVGFFCLFFHIYKGFLLFIYKRHKLLILPIPFSLVSLTLNKLKPSSQELTAKPP